MKHTKWSVALAIWIGVAVIVVAATFIAIIFFSGPKTTPLRPQVPLAPPSSEPPAQKGETDKPVQPIKPKTLPPQAKGLSRDDLGPGKVRLCPNSKEVAVVAGDGRLLGHHPYANAEPTMLSSSPAGFNNGSCSQLHGEAKVALEKLIAGARASDPAIADAMIGLSCFRSSTYQREVFCRKVADGFAVRARASAPPGYSEHATGYAVDFGDRNNPQCNLSACFAATPVGAWVVANAGQYGFVLSFPKGNGQGVMYEPWHWRFQGSAAAKATFAAAN